MRLATITMSLVLLLSGCGTFQVGGNFDLAAFQSKVRRGETTQAEVQRMLGAPDGTGVSVETGGERYSQWTYLLRQRQPLGAVQRAGEDAADQVRRLRRGPRV
jgi:hypothetical protein